MLELLQLDFHAHPRMNATLKTVFTFREFRNLDSAAVKDSRLGSRNWVRGRNAC